MSSPLLLTKIDDLIRDDHSYLDHDDACYFLREYTAGAGFAHSVSNDIISNLKKPMDRHDKPEWRYKERAIAQCARDLIAAMRVPNWRLDGVILVPAPPSKTKANPSYDDRMIRIAEQVAQALSLEVSELLEARTDREPQHASATKRDIDALHANLRFNPRALATRPSGILLLDDVLTTGATFVACKSVLQQNLRGILVAGVFVARRVPQPAPWPPVANEQ